MDLKLIWTQPAIDQLGEIIRYIGRHNAAAAPGLGQRLLKRVEITTAFPEIGPLYFPAASAGIRCLIEGKIRIYYRVNPANRSVEILALRHTARAQPDFS